MLLEKAVTIGESALAGIVTEPPLGKANGHLPAVLLLNAGILHRVGACRLSVKLARQLADRGYRCVRFDHSGIGDSGARRGSMSFEEAAVLEVQDVMRYMTDTYGARTFILYGLCSGADVSFSTAVADPRVVGIIQLDPWVYRTVRSRITEVFKTYGTKLLNPVAYARAIGRGARRMLASAQSSDRAEWYADTDYIRVTPPKEVVAKGLRTLVDRGVSVLIVFSGGHQVSYNYRQQYQRAFRGIPFAHSIRVEFAPKSTHLFTALDDQALVLDAVTQWLQADTAFEQPSLAPGIEAGALKVA